MYTVYIYNYIKNIREQHPKIYSRQATKSSLPQVTTVHILPSSNLSAMEMVKYIANGGYPLAMEAYPLGKWPHRMMWMMVSRETVGTQLTLC